MTIIGYHNSHEQFRPSELLRYSQMAEDAGFQAAMCSDHFHPWSERQGQSGFAWSWLGSALQATNLSFGTVCAPVSRYHPAVIAQALATLTEMYPERVWCAFGSGEYLNEHITGEAWPAKAQRNEHLKEAVEIIRRLWCGEMLTHRGYFTVQEAKLYTLPEKNPPVIGAAVTARTAEWMADWVDGVITVWRPRPELEHFVRQFRANSGKNKPMFIQVQISYAEDPDTARQGAWEQWRTNVFQSNVLSELKTPAQFDAASENVQPEELDKCICISSDLDQHIAWLQELIDLGFERIYLHNVNRNQEQFIRDFGKHVLPALTA